MVRRYEIVQRIQPVKSDQLSVANKSETSNQTCVSSSSESSSSVHLLKKLETVLNKFLIRIRRKGILWIICFETVRREIHDLTGKVLREKL
jgi:hypothetical protein